MEQQQAPMRANQGAKPKNPAMDKLTDAQRELIKKKRRGEPLTADEKKQYKEIRKILQGGESGAGAADTGKKKGKKAKTPPAGDGQDGTKPPDDGKDGAPPPSGGGGSNGNGNR